MNHRETARKLSILVIDDAPVVIQTVSFILGDNYKVYGMTDPNMVEYYLKQVTPELFLLNYNMPQINGFELVEIIRKFNKHKDTPIIFLTSPDTQDHAAAVFPNGACDFIVKPFDDSILCEKVARNIERKK